MINVIFALLMLGGILPLMLKGEGGTVMDTLLGGAQDAVSVSITLAGSFALFCGLMEILKRAGAVAFLNRLLRKPLHLLLGRTAREEAMEDVTLNLSCNMLGLGNAATPAGVRAACALASGERATDALCVFLVLNASSVQLFPASVVALRAACGSQDPACIIFPTLIATLISSFVGVTLCKLMERIR